MQTSKIDLQNLKKIVLESERDMPIRLHLDTRGKKLVNYYKDFRDTLEIEDSRSKMSMTCWHWQLVC
jgi:hypothetical protein